MIQTILTLWLASAATTVDNSALNEQYDVDDRLQICLNSPAQKPFNPHLCLELLSPNSAAEPDSYASHTPVDLARAHSALAVGYAAGGKLVEADRHVREAESLAANDWHVLANSGVVHLHANRFVEAQQSFTQAMTANPDFPPHLLLNRSLAWRGLGRFVESARDVEEYEYLTGTGVKQPHAQIGAQDCATTAAGCKPAVDVGPHPDRSGFRNPR